MFKEARKGQWGVGVLPPRCFRCFANLCFFQPCYCLHLCIKNTDSPFPPPLRTLCPYLLLSLFSHTLTHPQCSSCCLPNARRGLSKAYAHCRCRRKFTCARVLFFFLTWAPAPSSEDAGLQCHNRNWSFIVGTSGYLQRQVKRSSLFVSVCVHMFQCNRCVFCLILPHLCWFGWSLQTWNMPHAFRIWHLFRLFLWHMCSFTIFPTSAKNAW